MMETVICMTLNIVYVCLVLLFQVLNIPSQYVKFRNLVPFKDTFQNKIAKFECAFDN